MGALCPGQSRTFHRGADEEPAPLHGGDPGGKKAVDHLNLEIAPGDIYGFIGHNGAGKTTTIKAITGIIDFEEGEILVDGVSVRKDPLTCKRKIAYIPDNPDLYGYLTGIQYLNFIGDIFQVPVSEREERIRKYGELFELMPALGDLISSYSHGMKQKLAIISALLHKPSLMILDEPSSAIDLITLQDIVAFLEHMKGETTMLMVAHSRPLLERVADRIIDL